MKKVPLIERLFDGFIKDVCKELNISDNLIKSKVREEPHVIIRHFLMHAAVTDFQFTTVYAGKMFNKDHSSIVYARNKVSKAIKNKTLTYTEKLYVKAIKTAVDKIPSMQYP